tara:strand:- start:1918 stop:2526 length:609 start_codon:yes stop_codon:yes gene_type:complete
MANTSDLSSGLLGGLSGAAGLASLGKNALLGPAGFIIGGIAGLLGSKSKRDQQNKQIRAHNKKIDKQKKLVKGQQKDVGNKMAGVGNYFDALSEYQTNIIDKNEKNALDSFLASTVGQIEDFADVSARTGLESSTINKKISTIRDLTSSKSEDIKESTRAQKQALSFDLAGKRRQMEQSGRNLWQDLSDQYDLLGEEYMSEV